MIKIWVDKNNNNKWYYRNKIANLATVIAFIVYHAITLGASFSTKIFSWSFFITNRTHLYSCWCCCRWWWRCCWWWWSCCWCCCFCWWTSGTWAWISNGGDSLFNWNNALLSIERQLAIWMIYFPPLISFTPRSCSMPSSHCCEILSTRCSCSCSNSCYIICVSCFCGIRRWNCWITIVCCSRCTRSCFITACSNFLNTIAYNSKRFSFFSNSLNLTNSERCFSKSFCVRYFIELQISLAIDIAALNFGACCMFLLVINELMLLRFGILLTKLTSSSFMSVASLIYSTI